jgi:hypothetical protein
MMSFRPDGYWGAHRSKVHHGKKYDAPKQAAAATESATTARRRRISQLRTEAAWTVV